MSWISKIFTPDDVIIDRPEPKYSPLVTRNVHFEPFYWVIWHFLKTFDLFSSIWSGHPAAWNNGSLSSWLQPLVDQELSAADYITVYGIFGLFQSITFVAGILTLNRRTLAASLNLHKSIFHRVLHSTIDFIWTTPVGQVSTRCT